MRIIDSDPTLKPIFDRCLEIAANHRRTLPEMRFYILTPAEFTALLEKKVYPTSPISIWEGRNMVKRKQRIQTGQESALYYEVVQTGNPSYGYLNATNSDMMQASVIAHVVGHCEFSELNVMHDTQPDRTEHVMHLVKKVDLARQQMGHLHYQHYWNASESLTSLIAPNSQYNVQNAVDADRHDFTPTESSVTHEQKSYQPFSSTLNKLFETETIESVFQTDIQKKIRSETLSRKGYQLRVPCQDVFGFLRTFAPVSASEATILDYLYTVHAPHDFVGRTQIMNEGWAMYWEKTIMLQLFEERVVKGVIDYAKVFSGVCYPRPYFQRNPYHLGYHMWLHIEEMLKKGRISLDYVEEKDRYKKDSWDKPTTINPVDAMTHLVQTITDYEFLRRYLTEELVFKFHLNRIDKRIAGQLGITARDCVSEDPHYVWLDPAQVKAEMLAFFTHMGKPRIYIIDDDYLDGGLLLYHRDDGQPLKESWIEPTLKNIHHIWKAPVYIQSRKYLYGYKSNSFKKTAAEDVSFEQIVERMKGNRKPI